MKNSYYNFLFIVIVLVALLVVIAFSSRSLLAGSFGGGWQQFGYPCLDAKSLEECRERAYDEISPLDCPEGEQQTIYWVSCEWLTLATTAAQKIPYCTVHYQCF